MYYALEHMHHFTHKTLNFRTECVSDGDDIPYDSYLGFWCKRWPNKPSLSSTVRQNLNIVLPIRVTSMSTGGKIPSTHSNSFFSLVIALYKKHTQQSHLDPSMSVINTNLVI